MLSDVATPLCPAGHSAGFQPADATQSRLLGFGFEAVGRQSAILGFVIFLGFGILGFGISARASSDSTPKITLTSTPAQILRFGIDAERLWFWRPEIGAQLAALGVTELKADFVRVAIDCAYEREEGVKKPEVYTPILAMMAEMKKASPNIKFFATPRPLFNAYTKEESRAIFGKDQAPWTPYPGWISGLKQFGTTKLDVKKLTQYFADYLNLMHKHGFDIDYMDITNEKQLATAASMLYIHEALPTLLDKGVKMPLLLAPSTYDYQAGADFLNSIDPQSREAKGFDIASTHNTKETGSPEAFAKAARRLDKEAWSTELHNWTGVTQAEDIKNSQIFWRHIRAGFSGFDTWLFYGSEKLRPHSMIGANGRPDKIIRTAKYEIYKKVANTVNLGNYVPSTSSVSALMPVAMKKGDQMLVCILNTTGKPVENITVELPAAQKIASDISATFWDETTPAAGKDSALKPAPAPAQNSFSFDSPPNTLWCFVFKTSGSDNP